MPLRRSRAAAPPLQGPVGPLAGARLLQKKNFGLLWPKTTVFGPLRKFLGRHIYKTPPARETLWPELYKTRYGAIRLFAVRQHCGIYGIQPLRALGAVCPPLALVLRWCWRNPKPDEAFEGNSLAYSYELEDVFSCRREDEGTRKGAGRPVCGVTAAVAVCWQLRACRPAAINELPEQGTTDP